jgi:hypothetical protein
MAKAGRKPRPRTVKDPTAQLFSRPEDACMDNNRSCGRRLNAGSQNFPSAVLCHDRANESGANGPQSRLIQPSVLGGRHVFSM